MPPVVSSLVTPYFSRLTEWISGRGSCCHFGGLLKCSEQGFEGLVDLSLAPVCLVPKDVIRKAASTDNLAT